MTRLKHWILICVVVLASAGVTGVPAWAEKVSDLPAPTGYISDFAGVISPEVKGKLEQRCTEVDREAHAQIAVVTIKTLENDQSIEEFATELEDKWKVGNKDDRGVLMVLVMTPRRGRIEVGYGLEGILNDAKVGDIGRSMVPDAAKGDYDSAVTLGVGQISRIIAADAGVTLTPIARRQRVSQSQPAPLTFGQMLTYGVVALIVLFVLFRSGGSGLLWFLLGDAMGGGFGGGRRGGGFGGGGFGDGGGGGDDGGGFGGFDGGSSGGGGASGDF